MRSNGKPFTLQMLVEFVTFFLVIYTCHSLPTDEHHSHNQYDDDQKLVPSDPYADFDVGDDLGMPERIIDDDGETKYDSRSSERDDDGESEELQVDEDF